MPQLTRTVVLGEQIPVRLGDDAKRSHERREPVVCGNSPVDVSHQRLDLAK